MRPSEESGISPLPKGYETTSTVVSAEATQNVKDPWDDNKRPNIHVTGVPEGEKKEGRAKIVLSQK